MLKLLPHRLSRAHGAPQHGFVKDHPQLWRAVSLKDGLPVHAGGYRQGQLIGGQVNARAEDGPCVILGL